MGLQLKLDCGYETSPKTLQQTQQNDRVIPAVSGVRESGNDLLLSRNNMQHTSCLGYINALDAFIYAFT